MATNSSMAQGRSGRSAAARMLGAAALAVAALLSAQPVSAAPTPSIQVTIPDKQVTIPGQSGEFFPIAVVKIPVAVTSVGDVVFTVTGPGGSHTFAAIGPGDAEVFQDLGTPIPDTVRIVPPSAAAGVTEAEKRLYTVYLTLVSNEGAACADAMSGNEVWTIAVTGPQQIAGACSFSLDHAPPGACGGLLRSVPVSDGVATITSPAVNASCQPGIDVAFVLDRSGSMSDPVQGSVDPTKQKIVALRDAVQSFVDVWQRLRANEQVQLPPTQVTPPVDHAGVVFFDDVVSWLKASIPNPADSNVDGMETVDATIAADIKTNVVKVAPRDLTSIGGGLKEGVGAQGLADPALAGNGNRKAVVLMTDGMQNAAPLVSLPASGGNAGKVVIAGTPEIVVPDSVQIYTVGVGTGTAIDPPLLQGIAEKTKAFYMNTEDDAGILPLYFVELIQNFARFNSVETFRLLTAETSTTTPFQTKLQLSTTTRDLVLHLAYSPAGPNQIPQQLRLELIPPGGTTPILPSPVAGAAGRQIYTLVAGPESPSLTAVTGIPGATVVPVLAGEWTLTVRPVAATSDDVQPAIPPVRFNLIALGDDSGVSSDLRVVPAGYAIGEAVKIEATVRQFGQPLTGLNAQAGAVVEARLVRPGVSLGDVLSDSTASATPPDGADPTTPAQAKLDNLLAKDPGALQRTEEVVTLVDDGSAASGDATAGDGTYTGVLPTSVEGHFQALISVQAAGDQVGTFTRQQIRSTYVRALPAAANTPVNAQVQTIGGAQTLVLSYTPRTQVNTRMGPGFANYFWFTAPGIEPFRGTDNLDGSYTAKVALTGDPPQPLSLHFIPDLVVIPDDATAATLPVVPGSGNVLVASVPLPAVEPSRPLWLWLLLLLILLIAAWLIWRRFKTP